METLEPNISTNTEKMVTVNNQKMVIPSCWNSSLLPVEILRGGALWSSRPVWTAGLERRPLPRLLPFQPGWRAAGRRLNRSDSPWNQKDLQPRATPFLHRSPWSSLRGKDRDRPINHLCDLLHLCVCAALLHCDKVRRLNTTTTGFMLTVNVQEG